MLESNSKLYYSIKEVSEMTELKPYVLRYWESEFPSLKPTKNKAGNRTYKKHDIQVILDIKVLLYDKKFTIKGAVEELKNRSNKPVNDKELSNADGDAGVLDGGGGGRGPSEGQALAVRRARPSSGVEAHDKGLGLRRAVRRGVAERFGRQDFFDVGDDERRGLERGPSGRRDLCGRRGAAGGGPWREGRRVLSRVFWLAHGNVRGGGLRRLDARGGRAHVRSILAEGVEGKFIKKKNL